MKKIYFIMAVLLFAALLPISLPCTDEKEKLFGANDSMPLVIAY